MKLDGFCFVFGVAVIPLSFLLFPHLFFNKKRIKLFFIATLVLALAGLSSIPAHHSLKPNFYLYLACPLYALSVLRLWLWGFYKKFDRNPIKPPRSLSGSDGWGQDRLFYFSFMIMMAMPPLLPLVLHV